MVVVVQQRTVKSTFSEKENLFFLFQVKRDKIHDFDSSLFKKRNCLITVVKKPVV